MEREPNTQYIASISYGKDSMAMLEAIKLLGFPIDRILTADVWATDDIPADLPPMVAFKDYADREILKRYGIKVEHICAMRNGEKLTYEKLFYHVPKRKKETAKKYSGTYRGFPAVTRPWCNSKMKVNSGKFCNEGGGKSADFRESGTVAEQRHNSNAVLGFPIRKGNWCTSALKKPCFPNPPHRAEK